MLLATATLLFVQIVATTTKEAMGAEDYVRPAMQDVGVGVVVVIGSRPGRWRGTRRS